MKRGYERRNFFRAAVPGGGHAATLQWDKTRAGLRVVEESAGGFSAISVGVLEIERGTVAKLRCGERFAEVRVTHVQRHGTGQRLGLELIRDLTAEDMTTRRNSSKSTWLMVGMAATAMIAAMPMFLRDRDRAAILAIVPFMGSEQPWRPKLPPLVLKKETRQTIREHTGLDLLVQPEIARLLGLSDLQRAEFQELVTEQNARLNKNGKTSANELSVPIAESPATQLLTPEQQWRLMEMVGQSVSPLKLIERTAQRTWPRANARQLFDRLGAAALALPSAAKELHLRPEQREQIAAIVELALDTSEDLFQQAASPRGGATDGSSDPATDANAVLEQARQDVLAVLSSDQAHLLESMPR
ncbi:MAG TPA: hypothetical protein VHZ24_05585 [Pirellulales bacterium]|jgi:hypothetical protein|nr:hypothetical protein [Pirellulales bacterium]